MNTSNTKLDSFEKWTLQLMKAELSEKGGEVFHFPDDGLTVAIMPDGKVSRVATSIMSPDEKKYRRKVGAYHAVDRLLNGESMAVPLVLSQADFARYLADYQ